MTVATPEIEPVSTLARESAGTRNSENNSATVAIKFGH
jgi:hypothetical protein